MESINLESLERVTGGQRDPRAPGGGHGGGSGPSRCQLNAMIAAGEERDKLFPASKFSAKRRKAEFINIRDRIATENKCPFPAGQ